MDVQQTVKRSHPTSNFDPSTWCQPNRRRPLLREAGPGCSYLLIIITASVMAIKERDGPSARRGQLMMTRDDLQLLTSCCSRSDIRTDICSLRLFHARSTTTSFCLPSSLYPKGSVLFFLPANVPHKSRGRGFRHPPR